MTYEQLKSPNLSTLGNIGWCLSFAEDVFGTPHLYPTATNAWEQTQFKHHDRNLPNVSAPVWYSYYENGINYGHVAVYVPGRGVLSSPYKSNNSQQWFADIDECARVLGCSYLGWTEDIAGVSVAKLKEEHMTDETTLRITYNAFLGRDPQEQDKSWLGKPLGDLEITLDGSEERKIYLANQAKVVADLEAQVKDLTKKLEISQAGNGDATRWQTLKTLIKALIS